MKLLFDQNLSFKLCARLRDLFPGSQQVRLLGLDQADDTRIWTLAAEGDYVIVTQDVDFVNLNLLKGSPPKVIWLRCGNQPTDVIERILRSQSATLLAFANDPNQSFVELWK
jgi:predicted nuclease of predicted toxin-antitoxin system